MEATRDANYTSNDLLAALKGPSSHRALNYEIVVQSADELRDVQNSPAISMASYLVETGQTELLAVISIYAIPGDSREEMRFLYMNATAVRIWKAMGKQLKTIGGRYRPPRAAALAFGVPFSQ
jgi:hypothetical protein